MNFEDKFVIGAFASMVFLLAMLVVVSIYRILVMAPYQPELICYDVSSDHSQVRCYDSTMEHSYVGERD